MDNKHQRRAFTVDHNSAGYYAWLWVISAAFVYNLILVPVRASFVEFNLIYADFWIPLDYAFADGIYLIDIVVRMRTRVFDSNGILVDDTATLHRRYFKSGMFICDLLSILPTDIALLFIGYSYVAVRLNRLLRFRRFLELTLKAERRASFPNVFRWVKVVFYFVLALLYVATIYNALSKAVGYAEGDNEFMLSKSVADGPFLFKFTKCFYWAATTVYLYFVPSKALSFELVLLVALRILGCSMVGALIGSIGEIEGNVNQVDGIYNRQLRSISSYLQYWKLPEDVTQKVINWYKYSYENHLIDADNKAVKILPDKLKAELALDMHMKALKKVNLFANLEMNVLSELIVCLKRRVFSPNDYVCKKGDVGREMYVVRSGKLEVVSDDGSKVLVTLSSGSVFGEISLLSIPGSKAGNRRTANVRSKGYSDLFSLSKDDLYNVLGQYPDVLQSLTDLGTRILLQENGLDEESCKRKQEFEMAVMKRIDALETAIKDTEHTIAMLISGIERSHKAAAKRLDFIEEQVLRITHGSSSLPSLTCRKNIPQRRLRT